MCIECDVYVCDVLCLVIWGTEKENLCLYGFPDEAWEVNLPAEEVPPELPEPALGINFARDGMLRKDWLSLVAVHSDAWLLAVSFYYGARFDKNERSDIVFLEYMFFITILFTLMTALKGNRRKQITFLCHWSNRCVPNKTKNLCSVRLNLLQPHDDCCTFSLVTKEIRCPR
jgi:hypothetical protein